MPIGGPDPSRLTIGPLAADRHIFANPCGKLHDAGIGTVRVPARDLQHLVNQCLVADTRINCRGDFIFLFGEAGLRLGLAFRLVLLRL